MTKQPDFNPHQLLTYFDALQILNIVRSTEKCESVRLRFGGMQINLERVSADQEVRAEVLPAIAAPDTPATAQRPSAPAMEADSPPVAEVETDAEITAPMVGFFHRWSGPDGKMNVQAGDAVQATDTIGVVKAMGISKPIVAGVSGRVTGVLVADAGFVEYGQPVLRVRQTGQ